MDFKTQAVGTSGLAGMAADALLVLVASPIEGATTPALELDKPLADVLAAAVRDGDFAYKAGQSLYVHKVAGVKAGRVVFAFLADGSVKALRKAVNLGLAYLKAGGTRQLAVAVAGGPGLMTAAHAEALAVTVTDAMYVYRETKPSAPPASKLAGVSVVCNKSDQAAVNAGLKRGEALAAGMTLARECANRPANVCTPSFLAEQALQMGKEFGLKVEVLERNDCEKLGMGS
ncbi:MAG TPA: M17 family peptidase N-terminal domain-containing protein, partial [Rubrivivax sp.]|nr:M17 family peptidase N-terminal domain-containing protein [Rubrivivax sp.]